MATTTNYNWTTPDDTALVKDGAAAIRTLGSSIDTTTKALNPSTTLGDIEYRSSTANTNTRLPIGSSGQVLTVAAGVPSWATPSDQTPLTTKGDLFTFSTVDARLPVGTNGYILTADSAETTGLKWSAPAPAAGLTLINTTSFSAVASQSINDVFSTTYTNYKIIIDDLIVSTGNADLNFRLRVGGADLSATVYNFQILNIDGTSATASRETSQAQAYIGSMSTSNKNAVSLEIFNPFTTKQTLIASNNTTTVNTIREVKISTFVNNTTSYTGFTLLPSANNITGTVSVYGYNK